MTIDRRHLLLGSLAGSALLTLPARAAPLSRYGLDAARFGVHPNAPDDQSVRLQRALDAAARARVPLTMAPGRYRAGALRLTSGSQILGVRGATRLVFTQGPSLLAAEHARTITLNGLTFDGGGQPLPDNGGLVHFNDVRGLRVDDCAFHRAGGNAIGLARCDGAVTDSTFNDAADNALFCNDSRGLMIVGNVIRGSGNGGIRVWQSEKRHDGSLIADNRVADTHARAGGSGQNGNAINVFRAGNVIVRNNTIDKAAFSAIRGNAASEIQIIGNNCIGLGEVAIYSEFEFQGAVIADNIVDQAGSGISVTNFKEGGRLATVRGNIIRHCSTRIPGTAPDTESFGIGVEADTAVTGNVIEHAATAGISLGWGPYMRNVSVTGNVVRSSGMGVAVSVVKGTGTAVIADNIFSDTNGGAIVGMQWHKPVTGDLALAGAARYPQLRISGNQVS